MNIRYEEMNATNFDKIKEIQHAVFPESSFKKGFNALAESGPGVLGHIMENYYLVYADEVPAGICGFYIPLGVEEHKSIWLNWFGILPQFRGTGLGRKILTDCIEMAKDYMKPPYNVKYFRLYTSELFNSSAQPLYNSVMTLKEYYCHQEMFNDKLFAEAAHFFPDQTEETYKKLIGKAITIYSKSLDPKEILIPWNNYFMDLLRMIKYEKKLQN